MIAWAVDTMIAISLLMLVVLALRGTVARLFGAGWAYALWLLPALRLVLPPLPFDLPTLLPAAALIPAAGEMAAPSPPLGGPGQWVPLILALWAGGAAIFVLHQALSYRALLRQLDATARPAIPDRFGGIRVIESEAVEGPMAIGTIDRRIFVPPLFDYRYTPEEQLLAVQHELIHHRRGDLWWILAALFMLALNWFNPIAYAAFRAFRMDQEMSCDAAIAIRAPDSRDDYANALFKSASRPGLVAACPLGPADQLKRRLKMMKQHRPGRGRSIGGAAVVGALLAGGLGGTARAADEPQTVRDVIVKRVGKNGETIVLDRAELAKLKEKCAHKAESDVVSGTEKNKHRTRVVICSDKPVDMAALNDKLVVALEKARTELGTHEEMTAEQRAEAIAALEREIERLRNKAD